MSAFASLPYEIRLEIYQQYFSSNQLAEALSIDRLLGLKFSKSPFDIIRPFVLDKSIYEEASDIFYKENALCSLKLLGPGLWRGDFRDHFPCMNVPSRMRPSRFILSIKLRAVGEFNYKSLSTEQLREDNIIFLARDLWKFLALVIWCRLSDVCLTIDVLPSVSHYWKERIIKAVELVRSPPQTTRVLQVRLNQGFSATERGRVLEAFRQNQSPDILCRYILVHINDASAFEARAFCRVVLTILSHHSKLTFANDAYHAQFQDLEQQAMTALAEAAKDCLQEISAQLDSQSVPVSLKNGGRECKTVSSSEWKRVAAYIMRWLELWVGADPGKFLPIWNIGRATFSRWGLKEIQGGIYCDFAPQ